jgi:hippurate hydrolase
MHACGHDGHTSALVGAARTLLAGPKPPLPVRLLWQPAEERASGAIAMIADGVLDNVGVIFGGHLDRHYAPGTLTVHEGPVNAAADMFHIRITGKGGHGARPHEALDAVLVGSLLVTALQTIVSREVDPAHPSVLSVGSFQAGRAANVIAGEATLGGTIRAQTLEVREQLHRSLRRVAKAVGDIHGAAMDVQFVEGTPPVINLPGPTAIAREAALDVVGEAGILPMRMANMGGEDFAYFMEKVPGCYIRFGAQVAGRESFPAHSSEFDFDERALAAAAGWYVRVAHRAGEALLAERRKG